MNPVSTDVDLSPLGERLRGSLVLPTDPGYDAARAIWNGSIDRRPAAIARCAGTADVVEAVRFAREHELLVAVRGGGHNVAGHATCDGGLVIDLSALRGVAVDAQARIAHVGPGATWGDVDHETQAFGLATPGGIVSTTGVAGFTLGGGLGWLTRAYAAASDNLRAADVVTSDGELIRAPEDLLWGLRGGGGNFGIVTRFELELHPVGPTVLAGPRLYPLERAPELLALRRELTAAAGDELQTIVILRRAPGAPWIPPAVYGTLVVALVACWCGDLDAGRRALAPLDRLGEPLADALAPMPFTRIQSFFDAAWEPGFQNYWKAEYLDDADDAAFVRLAELVEDISPLSDAKIMQLGGALARIGEDASALAHRAAPTVLNINARWTDPAESERHVAWTREVWREMQPWSTGGVYVNFLGEEGRNRVRAAYGEKTYDRLVALKDRYDPDNFFHLNQNIEPSQS
jgi:FAD/FMN-containing dehydrogenase